jgi:hypothetical protein
LFGFLDRRAVAGGRGCRESVMATELTVSLDEFAELAGVTSETMRVHLKELLKDGGESPAWLLERGDRGRAYKIEPVGGIEWWRSKREEEDRLSEERRDRLAQLRMDLVGEATADPDQLTLSGRQRREEIAAAMEMIKYRRTLGQLVEKADLDRALSAAAVEHRRRLQRVAPEFGIEAGLSADQVKQLERKIERAVDQFVTAISQPDALAERGG